MAKRSITGESKLGDKVSIQEEDTGIFHRTTISAEIISPSPDDPKSGVWDEDASRQLEKASSRLPSDIHDVLDRYERAAALVLDNRDKRVTEDGKLRDRIATALTTQHNVKQVRKAISEADAERAAWWTFMLVGNALEGGLRPLERHVRTGKLHRAASRRGRLARVEKDEEKRDKWRRDARKVWQSNQTDSVRRVARELSRSYAGSEDAGSSEAIRKVIGEVCPERKMGK